MVGYIIGNNFIENKKHLLPLQFCLCVGQTLLSSVKYCFCTPGKDIS